MTDRDQNIIPLPLILLQKSKGCFVDTSRLFFAVMFLCFYQWKSQAQIPDNIVLTFSPSLTTFNHSISFTTDVNKSAVTSLDLSAATASIIPVKDVADPFDSSDTSRYTTNCAPVISHQIMPPLTVAALLLPLRWMEPGLSLINGKRTE